MIPYPHQIARGKQAELRREAEMNRLSRVADQRKPGWIKRTIYIATTFAMGVIFLLEFVG